MKVSQETHNKVVEIVCATLEKARKLWPSKAHLIRPLKVDWNINSVRVAGRALMGRDIVSYNVHYIGEKDFWDTTVPHEVAHHLQKWFYPLARQAHGPEFRMIMASLGHSTRTRHSMAPEALIEAKPNQYVCPNPNCGKTFNLSNVIHNRIQRGARRYCADKVCKGWQKRNYSIAHIQLKGAVVKSKEVSVKEILPEVQKLNLVTPPIPTVQPTGKVVGPAKLSDIISGGWWNS